MASEIDELISEQSLKNWNQFVSSLDKAVTGLDKVIKNANDLDSVLGKLGISTKDVKNAQEAVNKAEKEAAKIQKQLQDSEDEIVKAKIRFNKVTKEQREHLAAMLTLEDKEAGTLEKLAARNKILREEQRKLNLETAEGIRRNKEINTEINKNTAFIKQNSDALVKHKMNVGNYTGSIMAAGKELAAFLGVAGGGAMILSKLKDAFMQTEQGVNFFKRATEGVKTFFQSLVKGDLTMAGPKALMAMEVAKKMNEIRIGDRQDLIEIAKLETEINILRYQAADATLSETAQLEALTKAQAKEDELIKYKIADKKEELNVLSQMLAIRTDDNELWNEYYQIQADIIAIEGDRNLRLESRATALREKLKKGVVEVTQAEERGITVSKLNTEQLLKGVTVANQGKESELQFNQAVWDSNEELAKQRDRINKEETAALQQKQELQAGLIESSFELGQNLFDVQMQRLEMQQDAELKLAGDNAAAKEAIEEKYNKKKIALQRKAAIVEKVQGIFSIGIDTAKGVMSAMSKVATIPLVPWIIATGAIQMAAVASKPLPQYAKGTKYSEGGPAIVGERGRELVISPSGQTYLTAAGPELVYLQRGSEVIPSNKISMAGEVGGLVRSATMAKGRSSSIETIIDKTRKDLISTIKNQPQWIFPVEVGQPITCRKGYRYSEYFNRHLR